MEKAPEFFTKRGDFVGITHGFTESPQACEFCFQAAPLPVLRLVRLSFRAIRQRGDSARCAMSELRLARAAPARFSAAAIGYRAGQRVLHVAPEVTLFLWLISLSCEYLSIDLYKPAMRQMDLTDLDFADGSKTLVWCSHVLQYVADDEKRCPRFIASSRRAVARPPGSDRWRRQP